MERILTGLIIERKRGLFVFVGPVASGKTTTMIALKALLERKGALVVTVSYKTSLYRLALMVERISPRNWYAVYSKIFDVLLIADLALWGLMLVFLSVLSKFFIVLAEGHLIGALGDYIYISEVYLRRPLPSVVVRALINLCARLKPEVIVHLDIDPDESKRRQLLRRDSRLEHEIYFTSQRKIMDYLVNHLREISGTRLVAINTRGGRLVETVTEIGRKCFELQAE